MADPSQSAARPLRTEEVSLIRALLKHANGGEPLLPQLERALVRDMDDGGMGSLKFAGDERRSLGACIVEAEYVDCDGVPVSIALNVDTSGQLYELDIWKVDFALLREYPTPERVTTRA